MALANRNGIGYTLSTVNELLKTAILSLKKLKTMSEETIGSIFAAPEVSAIELEATEEVSAIELEATEEVSAIESETPSTEGKIFTQNGITYKRIKQGDHLVDIRV
jgi:hypothetical protein